MRWAAIAVLVGGVLLETQPVWAGMPSVGLTEIGRLGLEGMSFFAMGLLVSAVGVQWLWNLLAQDFPRLPQLTYPRACGLVVLWGLLFVVVLAMISGARELMTPRAWEKKGATYRLAEEQPPTVDNFVPRTRDAGQLVARTQKLSFLGDKLRAYAEQHDGQFPADIAASGLDPEQWRLPGADVTYRYVAGATLQTSTALVAYEPNIFGDAPLVLFANGHVAPIEVDVLIKMLPEKGTE